MIYDDRMLAHALDALARIAADPDETPERRARAQAALDGHFGPTDLLAEPYPTSMRALVPSASGAIHRNGHDAFLHAQIDYDGGNPRR